MSSGNEKTQKKTITICASAAHYRQVMETADELERRGFSVRVPKTAKVMRENDNFRVEDYKTWFKNEGDFDKKRDYIESHFAEVIAGDAVLVVNLEKRGMKGYVGGNVLMEMAIAFHYKKPIFLLHPVEKELPVYEEVMGLSPTVLHGDLEKLTASERH